MSMVQRTPPRLPAKLLQEESAETPGPSRARINNLQKQVSELVRKNQGLERKIGAETTNLQNALKVKVNEVTTIKQTLKTTQKELERSKKEIERCVSEGSGMREELQLHSMVQQQKALLAVAQEQKYIVELESKLIESERARILRDHKIALFQAREQELLAELQERDAHINELKMLLSQSNASLDHERNTALKASTSQSSSSKELHQAQTELASAQSEISSLEQKIVTLETKVRGLRDREKEARSELENWLLQEGSASKKKEKKELQTQLRAMKTELERKREEVEELKEELEEEKSSSKEREKVLKIKLREIHAEKERFLGMEEELDSLKAESNTAASPKKSHRLRKTSPAPDDSEEENAPKKKLKSTTRATSPIKITSSLKAKSNADNDDDGSTSAQEELVLTKKTTIRSSVKTKAKSVPLEISEIDNKIVSKSSKPKAGKKKMAESDSEPGVKHAKSIEALPIVDKKKKKRILGAQPAPSFTWDPVMNSGDGVIPTYLSPVKTTGAKTVGTIPRSGFSSLPSSRLNRFT
ncbi:hypothetical protein L204_100856 [Cryptococcus depauperatus]|nr:hypothetical protein L204_01211 [Cryptococcus depauperatus CBS 7855]